MENETLNTWTEFLTRIFFGAGAIMMWVFSIIFSANCFGFVVGTKYYWMGTLLAIFGVTMLEVMFNEGKYNSNPTIAIFSILAYGYGIVSNWVGIWVAMGAPAPSNDWLFIGSVALAIVVGTLIETIPEPVFLIALFGDSGGRDLLTQLKRVFEDRAFGNDDDRPSRKERKNHGNPAKGVRPELFRAPDKSVQGHEADDKLGDRSYHFRFPGIPEADHGLHGGQPAHNKPDAPHSDKVI